MKTWIYSWLIYPIGFALARVVAFFNAKVGETLALRAWKDHLSLRFNAGARIEYWVHVASAGELEYAIPVLRELEKRKKKVLVTYYSISAKGPVEKLPSQFQNVSLVVPLPHDGLGLMREFVALAKRQGVERMLLLKYELWPGLLWECNRQGVRVVLIDALKPSWFHRRLLHKVDLIIAGYSGEVAELNHPHVSVLGDTRVERVVQRIEQSAGKIEGAIGLELKERLSQGLTIVFGSMWPADDNILGAALADQATQARLETLVWVPHELDREQAEKMRDCLKRSGYRIVDIEGDQRPQAVLSGERLAVIVMKKGLLAELYRLGQAAYVGGGFGRGVHSVWEPALFGIPVSCGPRTERSPEAKELEKRKVLRVVVTGEELVQWIGELGSSDRGALKSGVAELVERHRGAAERIVAVCEANEARS